VSANCFTVGRKNIANKNLFQDKSLEGILIVENEFERKKFVLNSAYKIRDSVRLSGHPNVIEAHMIN